MIAIVLDIKAYDYVNRRILYNMIKKLGLYGKMDKRIRNFQPSQGTDGLTLMEVNQVSKSSY